ncbi:MAG TPA: polyphosphate kinase, partial [Sphingomonas sp.]|nr:polyphosphate kinase [Sphingomonas sp.]
MTINLSDYEKGERYDGDFDAALARLQHRLEKIQVAHIVHAKRSVVMVEGWDAAGKGGIIKRMTALLDPRYCRVWSIAAPTAEEKGHHFLWRFWVRLPAAEHIAV